MTTAVLVTPKRLYGYDAIALTAGEWALRLGLGFDGFWDFITDHKGDVEAAIAEIITLLNDPVPGPDDLDDELWVD